MEVKFGPLSARISPTAMLWDQNQSLESPPEPAQRVGGLVVVGLDVGDAEHDH